VDFAGQFRVEVNEERSDIYAFYTLNIISTTIVHLEMANGLGVDSFLSAFSRMISDQYA